MWELTKSFRFEAAHALSGTTFGAASEEIHGHSFRTEVSIRGTPDPKTGMVIDLGLLGHQDRPGELRERRRRRRSPGSVELGAGHRETTSAAPWARGIRRPPDGGVAAARVRHLGPAACLPAAGGG